MSKQIPKDKELTIPEKLKQLLRLHKNASQTTASQFGLLHVRPEEFVLLPDVFKEIGLESPSNQRLKAMKRLPEEFFGKRLEHLAVENLLLKTRDLIHFQQPKVHRQTTFNFLKAVISSQYDWLEPLMRAQLFHLIHSHDVDDDLPERIELLKALTRNGREIQQFEEDIGPFILHCMSEALSSSCILDFLVMLVNIMKFNSTYLDKENIMKIIWLTCHFACHTKMNEGVVSSLQVLEAIICYSCLPSGSLECIITTLCRTVNVEKFSHLSWKLIRNLLGTHLGHSSLYTMCYILQQRENLDDFVLLRGSVFFIGMCLWGSQKVSSLKFTHSSVLPYFRHALESNHLIVSTEVCLSVQRLVRKNGQELHRNMWDLVMDLMEILLGQAQATNNTQAVMLSSIIHEILTTVEQLYEQNIYSGSEKRLFIIIGSSASKRPERSVLRLIAYQTKLINPLKADWLKNLKNLVDRYYKFETRPSIRIKVLEIASAILDQYRDVYEDDLVGKIIIPSFGYIDVNPDMVVRSAAVQLLCKVALDCSSKSCLEILDILEKVIMQAFDESPLLRQTDITDQIVNENKFLDVKTAIVGLIEILKRRIFFLESLVAVSALRILIKHIEYQYDRLVITKEWSSLRIMIFDCFLSLRANENHQLGFFDSDLQAGNYSQYLLCSNLNRETFGQAVSPTLVLSPAHLYPMCQPTYVPLDQLFRMVSVSLKQEKDWIVLKHLLFELPNILKNKSILLSSPVSVGCLCASVCALLGDRNLKLPESLRNAPVTLSRSEFHSHVYPVQVTLVSYHRYLDSNMQRFLVTCLRHGLNSKCARTCIVALTMCILEMNETMYKLLPEVLLGLSKISATINIAIPILEFLSTLIRLPKLYACFVQDQYMSIFAVALPCTNPFKFNHYIVSLAHHVIAMWFIKCRLPFRKDFVRFIIKGLRNNMLVSFEEGGTLIEKKELHGSLGIFHKELTETCIDLLTRYTFAFCAPLPKRSHLTEFLLTSGQSSTWILGNTLVTITTSGCSTRASKYGLCEKCEKFCKGSWHTSEAELSRSEILRSESGLKHSHQLRRRHHSAAIQRSVSADFQVKSPCVKDDIQLRSGAVLNEHSFLEPLPVNAQSADCDQRACSCWCQGWTEVLLRRPTGNTSWVMRVQNLLQSIVTPDFSVADIASVLLSARHPGENPSQGIFLTNTGSKRIVSESLEEDDRRKDTQAFFSPTGLKGKTKVNISLPEMFASIEGSQEKNLEVSTCLDELSGAPEKSRLRKTNSSPDIRVEICCAPDGIEKLFQVDTQHDNLRYREADVAENKVAWPLEDTRRRYPSGIDNRPQRLPGIVERRPLSPVLTTFYSPTSPLHSDKHDGGHEDLPPVRRDRGHTISVMSPIRHKWLPGAMSTDQLHLQGQQSNINPSFVFLQLYYSFRFGVSNEKPIFLPKSESVERALKVLDCIHPYETHKIGVIYVGLGQVKNEVAILLNEFGSIRYTNFLHGLGRLVRLQDINPRELYTGGLDLSGPDGKFTYVWQDDIMQVIFHVATLMPTKKLDPLGNQKKLHIGNDFVSIVYNDSGVDYNMHTMKGQFIYACVIIQPLDNESNSVHIKTKPELGDLLGSHDAKIVSDHNLAILVRQLALHANLASRILQSQQRSPSDSYASNWLERLRQIRRLRDKHVAEKGNLTDGDSPSSETGWTHCNYDFTKFV